MWILKRRSKYRHHPRYIGAVHDWQEVLKRDHHPIAADGRFGPKTEAATRAYQSQYGLVPDGRVGPQTLAVARDLQMPERPVPHEVIGIHRILPIKGTDRLTHDFKRKIVVVSTRLGIDPNHLLAVMAFETGYTFSPKIRNPYSKMVGLIQFGRSAAKDLHTTVDDLSKMSAIRQLDYVEQYFRYRKHLGVLDTVEDVYMAVLYPRLIGHPPDATMCLRGSKTYAQNNGLDRNRDGRITKAEAAYQVTRILRDAEARARAARQHQNRQ